jgi:hypothetical protein
MKILWIIVLFAFLAAAVEAKRKRKFEGDFEFAEEVSFDRVLLLLYESRAFASFCCSCRDIEVLSGFWLCCLVRIGHSVILHYSPNENELPIAQKYPTVCTYILSSRRSNLMGHCFEVANLQFM